MKTSILYILIIIISLSINIQGQELKILKSFGSPLDETVQEVRFDNSGNIYISGTYEQPIDLTDTVLQMLVNYNTSDAFYIGFDSCLNFKCAQTIKSYFDDKYTSICVSAENEVYFGGFCRNAVWVGDTNYYGSYNNLIIGKLDEEANPLWLNNIANNSSGMNQIFLANLSSNYSDRLIAAGHFNVSPIGFGNGITLQTTGYYDIFVSSYSANGNVEWIKNMGGSNTDVCYAMVDDSFGNIFLTGAFMSTAYFDSLSLSSSGNRDIYVSKLDSLGNVLWVEKAGGSGNDYGRDIVTDDFGNCFVTGFFEGTVNFGIYQLESCGGYDIFLACLDSTGQWQWAESACGSDDDQAYGVAVSMNGGVYITGRFNDTLNFPIHSLISNGGTDIFLAKYDPFGDFLWANSYGGTSDDLSNSIDVSMDEKIVIAGYFQNSMAIDSTTITSVGELDVFVALFEESESNNCNIPNLYLNTYVNSTEVFIESYFPYSIDTSQYFLSWQMGDGTEFYQTTSIQYNYQAIDTFSIVLNIQDKNDSLCFLNIYDTIITSCFLDNLDFSMQRDSFNVSLETSYFLDTIDYQIIWDFGDSTNLTNQNNPVHFYNSYGYKTIILSVVYLPDSNCNQQIQKIINVDSVPCIQSAEIEIYENVWKHAIFELLPNVDTVNYNILWNLGDGTTIENQYLIDHTFPSTIQYDVTCKISHKADSNCILIVEKEIDLECYSNFGIDLYEIAVPYSGGWYYDAFADDVMNEPTYDYGLAWNWGNGDIDTLYNDWEVSGMYTVAGNYTVSYSYWDLNDPTCINYSNSFTITVEAPECEVNSGIYGIFIVPWDSMTISVEANNYWSDYPFSWSFGDGGYGGGLFDEHTYADYGFYEICVTANNNYGVGCSETYCTNFVLGMGGCNDTLALNYNPNADFNNGSCIYAGTQPISLPAGWSIFSTYIEPYENNIDSVFSEIVGNTVLVKNQIGLVYYPQYSITLLDTLALGQGYQVKMASGDTLNVTGIICQPQNSPISLSAGWNIIGYLLQSPIDISQIFSTIVSNTEIVKDDAGNVYWPQFSVNNIGNMLPGKGYQVKMNVGDVLVY
ncbi:MAG: hypothetical protein HOB05_09705 [Bacteroidetes bacterium]|nr:hypothetical protein [Bacteroidota bacterium]